jgi:hypothetical protein
LKKKSPAQEPMNWITETTKSKAAQLGFPLENVTWTEAGNSKHDSDYELWLHWTGKKTRALVSRKVVDGLQSNRERQRRETENWITQVLRSLVRYAKGGRVIRTCGISGTSS